MRESFLLIAISLPPRLEKNNDVPRDACSDVLALVTTAKNGATLATACARPARALPARIGPSPLAYLASPSSAKEEWTRVKRATRCGKLAIMQETAGVIVGSQVQETGVGELYKLTSY